MSGINLLAEDLDRMLRQPRDGEDLIDAVELSGVTARSLTGRLSLTRAAPTPSGWWRVSWAPWRISPAATPPAG